MSQELTNEIRELKNAIKQWLLNFSAGVRYGSDSNPFSMQRIQLTSDLLGTARGEGSPFKINFPVTSFHVEDATDSNTVVRVSAFSASINQINNYKEVKINDAIEFDRPVNELNLTWDAQPGKTMTLVVFVDMKFRSGSQLSLTAGGVSVTEGDTWSHSAEACDDATPALLLASNSDRKLGLIQNKTGYDLYVGSTNAMTADESSILVEPGESWETRYTGDVYGLFESGGTGDVNASEFE